MRASRTTLDDTDFATKPIPVPSVRMPVLVVLEGDDPQRVFVLGDTPTVLGRDPSCQISLADSTCSRRHARVEMRHRDGEFVAVCDDLGSTNGTFVNGERLAATCTLREHDKVRVGATLFGFLMRDELEMEADRRLLELATVDVLTGLLNRGAFDREFAREFERARRYRRPLTLLLLDIDHFKRINDGFGHPVGDRVLAQIGRIIRANVRTCDLAGRYGGEEMAVLLTETGPSGAGIAAERIRAAVANMGFATSGSPIPVTVSIGIGTVWPECKSVDSLVSVTDEALYAAKAAGRDRVEVAPSKS